jgi:hypothetical protein
LVVAGKVSKDQEIPLVFKETLLAAFNGRWQLMTLYASALVIGDECRQ